MQVPTSAQVTPPTVTVNNGVTVTRGFSTEVRSDVPPVQQGEGVRYTRGRPSDNDTYSGLYLSRKRNAPAETAEASRPPQEKDAVGAYGENPAPSQETAEADTEERVSGRDANAPALSPEDKALVEQLQKRDREVRLHELAHQAAGGQFTGSASYEYKRGPDGKNYAVGGEVSVDVGAARTPEDTIQKARQVKAAALAPAQPSAQDRQVAREAEQMISQAQQELRIQAQSEARAERKAREPSAEDKPEDEQARDAAVKRNKVEPDANVAAKSTPVAPEAPVVKASEPKEPASSDEKDSEKSDTRKDKVSAREALEKILLAGQSLTVQAGAAGYARPDAPAGDSGLLDIVI